jgi:exosome complex component MTR3
LALFNVKVEFQDDSIDISKTVQQSLLASVQLDAYPNLSIDVFITVLEYDGIAACISAAISAGSIALADSGLQLFGIVTSCSLVSWLLIQCFYENKMWLDCNEKEQELSDAHVVVSYISSLNQITTLIENGSIDAIALEQVHRI